MGESKSDPLLSLGLLVLRVGAGGMMLVGHGWSKVINFSATAEKFPDVFGMGSTVSLGLATTAEFLCATLVVIGLATRLTAFPLAVTMGIAVFWVQGGDPWFLGSAAAAKEPALLYLIPFVALILTGGGRFSADGILAERKKGDAS